MLFNSIEFLFVFLPVVATGYYLLRNVNTQWSIGWLLGASLVFYAAWDIRYLPLLLLSICFNYSLAIFLARREPNRLILTVGIAANLALLGYFKYANFFVETATAVVGYGIEWHSVVLPIGISFFTFQQIAFLVDVHRRNTIEPSLIRFGLFVSFFPQLIAGPIVHHKETMQQFGERHRVLSRDVVLGLTLLIAGLVKKIIIADTIAIPASEVFNAAASGASVTTIDAWLGAVCYSLQIYFDFSAYSDMAIGIALLLGIDLPINFASPYKASSISEFWRRWHITLSRFLRDYLYIPMGGSRRGRLRHLANLMVTMVLGGIWHGAGWTFLLWGVMHGIFLVLHRIWVGTAAAKVAGHLPGWKFASWAMTLTVVTLAWVPFRAADLPTTLAIWTSMAGLAQAPQDILIGRNVMPLVLSISLVATTFPNIYQLLGRYSVGLPSRGYPATQIQSGPSIAFLGGKRHSFVLGVALAIVVLNLFNISEFIYFQF